MRLITSGAEMRSLACDLRRQGKVVALVPTMGALHEGHLSLVRRARAEGGALVVSIFVNPTQFVPEEDYTRYPRNLEADLEVLRPLAPDAVFVPSAEEMYPLGFRTQIEPGEVAARLEGASRPGHFRGVATVVLKLFNLVRPHAAYFGQKDFQQAVVIRRMVEDLGLDVRIVVCPTVREPEGLAMSSRNAYLSADDRRTATVLCRSLRRAQELFQSGETRAAAVLEAMRAVFAAEPRAKLDYAAIVDPGGLEPVERVRPGTAALVAARVGPARLIDNLIFGPVGATEAQLIGMAIAGPARERQG